MCSIAIMMDFGGILVNIDFVPPRRIEMEQGKKYM
jgi:hypothetical protein